MGLHQSSLNFEAADDWTFYYLRTFLCVSYDTVKSWKNKFESGEESIKMHPNQVGQNLHLVKKSFQK